MNGIRRAAVVLLSLDKALAAEVMSQLRKEQVEALTMEIARLEDVTKEEQDAALEEFYNQGMARVHIERGGMEYAHDLLEQSLGKEKAGAILDNVKQSLSSVPFVDWLPASHATPVAIESASDAIFQVFDSL